MSGFEVVEDGDTYAANAGRKARAYSTEAKLPSLADDSGLEVDALEGRPGLYSARYASLTGDGEGDAANRAKMLRELAGVAAGERTARFRCVVALAFPYTTNVRLGEGVVEGRIAEDEQGELGFGYDPIFELPDGRRMAELTTAEKNRNQPPGAGAVGCVVGAGGAGADAGQGGLSPGMWRMGAE